MNKLTIGKIIIAFPFEPGLPCRMNHEEYEETKMLMSKYITGKQIKNWCDNDDSKEAKVVKEKYFSEGKSLGKFTYYYMKRHKNSSILVVRDYERSPRQ